MELNKIKLAELPSTLKYFLLSVLFAMLIGLNVGIVYLSQTTQLSPQGTLERFNGSGDGHEYGLDESYPKPIEEMLITTHSHIISFSLMLFVAGIIFYFSGMKDGFFKKLLLIEPPLSAVISFGSIWGLRFIHPSFIYLTIASAILLYSSLYFMILYSMKDLLIKRRV